jgi:hypothetical protein
MKPMKMLTVDMTQINNIILFSFYLNIYFPIKNFAFPYRLDNNEKSCDNFRAKIPPNHYFF